MPDTTHAFAGIETKLGDDGMSYVAWRGRCQCGHTEEWTDNKDQAWQEIVSHFVIAMDRAGLFPWRRQ